MATKHIYRAKRAVRSARRLTIDQSDTPIEELDPGYEEFRIGGMFTVYGGNDALVMREWAEG